MNGNLTFRLAALTILLGMLPFLATAQTTLDIEDDVLTYASLSDYTVTMTGRAELHLTDDDAPLSSCTINLNSDDAWLFLEAIAPSDVSSTYLAQVTVNGAAAAVDTNARIVQYGEGAVVIPHSSGFLPLEVFTEENFLGDSASLSQYTEYGTSALATAGMGESISSFVLKRGYIATFAQEEDGSGYSKCYVAADADLEIGVLPSALADQIDFIRVFPWRWTSKKGIAGNIGSQLDISWWYDWNLDQSSTLDKEYVAIRQERWWPDLASADWQARGINHVLGYNEPDNEDQSDIAVSDAIWSWPDMLYPGLRAGSPATTDGGLDSWLYPFIEQADDAGLRVDFVAVHYYWCYDPSNASGAATQMYNFLKEVHDTTGRPIWVTEWNNGADWTTCTDPTYAQQAECIAAMIEMMEETEWVERYALYNWVEDVRRVEWDDDYGTLTAAGEVYRDQASNIGYVQEIPGSGASPNATYYFNDDFRDYSGAGNHPLVYGAPKLAAGEHGNAINFDGDNDYLTLPTNMGEADDFTFAAWVYWDGGDQWQRFFDFGADESNYMFITPSAYSYQLRFGITTGGYSGEERLETSSTFPTSTWTHVAVTLSGDTGCLYVDGSLVDTDTISLDPSDLGVVDNFLGKSQFTTDPLYEGMLDDVVFMDSAMSATEIAALAANTPPVFDTDPIDGGTIISGYTFSGSIASHASDTDSGDTLTFAKAAGADWLTVASDGTLSGTPSSGDIGMNEFDVSVTDTYGSIDYATLQITVAMNTDNGYTIAWWRFEEGPADDYVPGSTGQTIYQSGAADVSGNGNHLCNYWDSGTSSITYSDDVTDAISETNNFSAINTSGAYPALMTWSDESAPSGVDIEALTFSAFTIEALIKPASGNGDMCIVGRDGKRSETSNYSPMHFNVTSDGTLFFQFTSNDLGVDSDDGAEHFELTSTSAITFGQWSYVAAVMDGSTLKLYAADLTETNPSIEQIGSLATEGADFPPQLAVSTVRDPYFSLFRGMEWGGDHGVRYYGNIDEVRISAAALDLETEGLLATQTQNAAHDWMLYQ